MKTEVRSDWAGAILVCGKCSRKADGGFGADGGRRLAKVLRKAIGGGKGRRAALGVVETGCLGICPRRAVVVVDSARPGRWQIVAPGTPTDAILARLGRDQPSEP